MADSDDDIQFQSFDNYFSGLPAATTPLAGTEPIIVFQGGTTKQTSANTVTNRTKVVALTNFYISTTGSDSNPGTITKPWATLQHAMDFIAANIDSGGFSIINNIGAGSFSGVGIKPYVGGGVLLWLGAGSASTTITHGSNDGLFNNGECFGINLHVDQINSLNAVKLSGGGSGGNNGCVSISAAYTTLFLGNILNGQFATSGMDLIFTQDAGVISSAPSISMIGQSFCDILSGSLTIDRTGVITIEDEFAITQNAFLQLELLTITIVGSPSYVQAFAVVIDFGIIYSDFNSVTFIGTVTATRFRVSAGSFIDSGGQGLTFFPGSSEGLCDPSSAYAITANSGGSAVPITVSDLNTNFPASGFTGSRMFVSNATQSISAGLGNIVAGGGGNAVPVYSDGTNWRIG